MRDLSKGLPPDYTEEEFRAYSAAIYEREQRAKALSADLSDEVRRLGTCGVKEGANGK